MKTRDLSGRVTPEEFEEAVRKFKRLKPENKRAAYLYLVEGKTYAAAQEECGIKHRAQIQLLVSRIVPELKPAGWETATVTLPPDLMARAKEMEKLAMQEYLDSKAGGAS